DKIDVARLPEAFIEARMALDLTSPGRALVQFADIDLSEFLIHRADRIALRLIPEWVREAHAKGSEDVLVSTIRTFADCSLNVKETARCLGVHTNTVYFRLNKIKKLTGADPRTFSGTSFLLTALRLLDRQSQDNGPP
ncbi:MAG TPA: helix-turn-helix domain-containing protein, partial [Candidatus Angelobacter sp.]|nr:helix-turn-helix domain-containing protein [Candidatus Angelobacter sp.]